MRFGSKKLLTDFVFYAIICAGNVSSKNDTLILKGAINVQIAIIADDTKKELMVEFCIAYCGILSKHSLCATAITAKYISDATGLKIEKMMTGSQGGSEQISARISYNEIDLLIFFRSTTDADMYHLTEHDLLLMCDKNNVPVATNIATAEILVRALDRGDLDWREIVNPMYHRHNV